MWHKPYGRTGERVSAVGFGGMRFPQPEQIDEMAAIVRHAYDRGVNYFDTAPGYCKDKSEEIMGAAIPSMDRSKIHVATKCMASDGGELRKSLERSLERLHVERIDFFHIWCLLSLDQWEARKSGGAVAAALQAQSEGLIKHVVVSSHLGSDHLTRVLQDGPFAGVLLGYCAINFPFRQAAVDAAGDMGLGVVTMNPLGGGIIPQNPQRFDFLRQGEDESVVAAAIRFNVSQPAVTTALVGFASTREVDEAVQAVEDFTPYSAERIDAIRRRVMEDFDGLCTGCGYCLPCPVDIEIPKMMDAYNARLLNGPEPSHVENRLKWHWGTTPQAAAVCTLCGACEEQCTQHLPIRDRLKEIAALSTEPRP